MNNGLEAVHDACQSRIDYYGGPYRNFNSRPDHLRRERVQKEPGHKSQREHQRKRENGGAKKTNTGTM